MSGELLQEAESLHRAGRLAEAVEIYRQFLRTNPRHFKALCALATIYFHNGKFDWAQYLFAEALRLDPLFLDGLCLRGVALLRLGRHEEALASFDRALSIRPDFVEALCNRGTVLQMMRRYEEALATFDQVLAIQPNHALSWNNRASTLVALHRNEEALADLDRALKIDPNLTEAQENRERVFFAMGRIDRAPPNYLRNLFDDFASYYDENMLRELDYRGPVHLRRLAERVLPGIAPPLRILDLGVGTGLVGEVFKDLAEGGCLDGIDLAPRMIEKARARGIYDDLVLGDLETVLMAEGPSYDLILAADTMVYLGDLAPTFAGVVRRLKLGGFFLFVAESGEGGTWKLTDKYRYRHGTAYLSAAAVRANLEFVDIMDCTIRSEESEPVPGFAVALAKRVA